jgi:hypothetical protein
MVYWVIIITRARNERVKKPMENEKLSETDRSARLQNNGQQCGFNNNNDERRIDTTAKSCYADRPRTRLFIIFPSSHCSHAHVIRTISYYVKS